MRASGPGRWRQDGGLHWTVVAGVCYVNNTRRRFAMRNWTMAILPLALVTGCIGTAPNDEQQAERPTERNGPPASVGPITTPSFDLSRSEARRVGKACVCTCRSRWSPYH